MTEYGLQLYSVRDAMEKDVKNTLKTVAEIGYKFVEFAGFFGVDAETMKAWLDECDLTASGTHTSIYEVRDHFEEIVKYHHTIDCKNLIIPWADASSPEKIAEMLSLIREYEPKLRAEGITLSYHNHDGEFYIHKDGILPYAVLEYETNIGLEVDTYWTFIAGLDSPAVIERLKDRITFIHLKDGTPDRVGKPLGTGSAPVKEVIAKAKELGFTMVVESENLMPDGLTEARNCFAFLKSIEA